MSERNGDKARFQKGRVRKLRQRQRIRELLARIRAGSPAPGAREPRAARAAPPALPAAAALPPAPNPQAPKAAASSAPAKSIAGKPAAAKSATRKPRPTTND